MLTIDSFFSSNELKPRDILAGFSGGADSTALIILLAEQSILKGFNLTAVHFEHGIRGSESVLDALWCEEFCEIRKIKFRKICLDVPGSQLKRESVEEAARRMRLEKWRELVKNKNTFVALGHNSNDRVENIFLRLFRGSNSSGLSSMRGIQTLYGITFIRPLLHFSRSEIESFLISKKITDWRNDRTNRDTVHKRNLLRNILIKQINKGFPYALKGILKACSALEQDADFIEETAFEKFQKIKKHDYIPFNVLKSHPAVLIRILRYWISEKTGYNTIPDYRLMRRIFDEVAKFAKLKTKNENIYIIPCDKKIKLLLTSDGLSLFSEIRKTTTPFKPLIWNWTKNRKINFGRFIFTVQKIPRSDENLSNDKTAKSACFDAKLFPKELILRTRHAGDKMLPFGFSKPVRLKKIFENSKIPSHISREYPVFCLKDGMIIWIPGVRRANFANVSPKTKTTIIIRRKHE